MTRSSGTTGLVSALSVRRTGYRPDPCGNTLQGLNSSPFGCSRASLRGAPGLQGAEVVDGRRPPTASAAAGGPRIPPVGRGRGQARPFVASDLAAVLATCHRPRRRGRGVESDDVAQKRGRLDAVIAGLLFMAGMRRSEVIALLWGDVAESADGDGCW